MPTSTKEQSALLKKIEAKHREVLACVEDADEMYSQDCHDDANDARAEADYAATELIALLEEARGLEMDTDQFPLVKGLIETYITEPDKRYAAAGGAGCH